MPLEPRPVEQWETIIGKVPAPEGVNIERAIAERILGDIEGYQHPTGTEFTRKRRQTVKDRDVIELAHAITAYARMYFDAGVRP